MSEKIHESISAIMDHEADELELRRLLRAMDTDLQIEQAWSRYHMVRSVLRRELPAAAYSVDLTSRVRLAIEDEKEYRSGFWGMLPKASAVAAVSMLSVLLAAQFFVKNTASPNLMATAPVMVNTHVQRAGYIVGGDVSQRQPYAVLRAQKKLTGADVQRIENDNSNAGGHVVLPSEATK